MKHYTSIEQSKKLLELGLNLESADMYYYDKEQIKCFPKYEIRVVQEDGLRWGVPCWSVGALLELMPNYVLEKSELGMYKCYSGNAYNSAIDAIFDDIVFLLINGHIKKGEKII